VSGKELMAVAKPYYITPAFAFVAYPNRDSTPFREFYSIPEAETIVRGTLRYQGFPEFIKALVDIGFLDAEPKEWLKEGITWAEILQKAVAADDSSEACVPILLVPPGPNAHPSVGRSSRRSQRPVRSPMHPRRSVSSPVSAGSVFSRARRHHCARATCSIRSARASRRS
jgi:hypothetical protein